MTSKNLFFKMIKQEFKQKFWCPIITFVLFFFVMEIQLLSMIQNMENHESRYDYSTAHYFANHFSTPDYNPVFTFATILMAIVTAFGIYGFIHSKQKLDLLHSLPVKRRQIFTSKYVAGILLYVIPLLIHVLFCIGIASAKGVLSPHGYKNFAAFLLLELLIFLLFYTATIFCMLLTGNMIISVFSCIVILPYSYIIYFLKMTLYERFYYSTVAHCIGKGIAFSPVQMIANMITVSEKYRDVNQGFSYQCLTQSIVYIVAGIIIYGILAFVAYLKRPTEAAGNPIAFPVIEPVVKFLVVIPVSLLMGEFFVTITRDESFTWYIFGVTIIFLLMNLIMESIFRLNLKDAFKHWKHIIFNGVCIALLIVILKNDVLGYNTYLPAETEIENVACSISGIYDSYGSFTDSYFYNQDFYNLEHMQLHNNENAYAFAKKLVKDGLCFKESGDLLKLKGTPEYDEINQREARYKDIYYKFQLKNGKTVYRKYYFSLDDQEAVQYINELFKDCNYKIGTFTILQEGWNLDINSVRCSSNWGDDEEIMLSSEQKNRLLDAYQSDIMNLSFEDVLNSDPIGSIDFIYLDKEKKYTNYFSGNMIYPQFTKTIAVLQDCGYDYTYTPSVKDIQNIEVIYYGKERNLDITEDEADENQKTYDAEEQMQEIISSVSAFGYFSYGNSNDERYDVKITYMLNNIQIERFFTFRKNSIPYFVENDFRDI